MHRVAVIAITLSASLAFAAVVREARPIAPASSPVAASESAASIYPVASTQLPARDWVRPSQAPNGAPWPRESSYLTGYWMGRHSGTASVTVDAGKHPSDALIRLYDVGRGRATAVRTAFVAGGERFTLASLDSGTYELRYRDLDSGALTRSPRFDVVAGEVTIALQTVRRMKADSLTSAELRLANAIEPDLIAD